MAHKQKKEEERKKKEEEEKLLAAQGISKTETEAETDNSFLLI
jgi:hypothetical protein